MDLRNDYPQIDSEIISEINKTQINGEETDHDILFSIIRKEFKSNTINDLNIDINIDKKDADNIRLRNFANNEDLADMDIFNNSEKKNKLDEQYLNIAKGGRMKNLKNIKQNIDVDKIDQKLVHIVKK